MPMLEELGYVPTTRYAFGEEIRLHLEAIADRFDLVDCAVPHRGDGDRVGREPRAGCSAPTAATRSGRYYVVMAVGILNLMKLPAIPGMEDFAGAVVPHRAVGLRVHRWVRRATRA